MPLMSAGAAAHTLVLAGFAAVAATAVIIALVARMLPRQNRRPLQLVALGLAGVGAALLIFLVIARPGEEEAAIDENVINPIAPTPESVAAGEALYRAQCQVCHGVSGGGNGPGAVGLNPPVSDFRLHLLAGHTDARFFHWISEGIPGTAMPAFKDRLSTGERWNVINFMRHAFTPAEK